jgi:hypothetical protein
MNVDKRDVKNRNAGGKKENMSHREESMEQLRWAISVELRRRQQRRRRTKTRLRAGNSLLEESIVHELAGPRTCNFSILEAIWIKIVCFSRLENTRVTSGCLAHASITAQPEEMVAVVGTKNCLSCVACRLQWLNVKVRNDYLNANAELIASPE